MKITLTNEQLNQVLSDGFISIDSESGFRIYIEYGTDLNFQYGEITHAKQTSKLGYRPGFCFNADDLNRLYAQKPHILNYCEDEPVCPNCQVHMIYKFECCPKCGQVLDWRESK